MNNSRSGSGNRDALSVTRAGAGVEELIASPFVEDVLAAANHAALTEDLALTILRRRDLQAAVLEAIARNHSVIKQRKVLVALFRGEAAIRIDGDELRAAALRFLNATP